jgi:hypothetical protein
VIPFLGIQHPESTQSVIQWSAATPTVREEFNVTLTVAHITPLVSLLAGFLILIAPSLLNYIVALYLIVAGAVGLNEIYHFVSWFIQIESSQSRCCWDKQHRAGNAPKPIWSFEGKARNPVAKGVRDDLK